MMPRTAAEPARSKAMRFLDREVNELLSDLDG